MPTAHNLNHTDIVKLNLKTMATKNKEVNKTVKKSSGGSEQSQGTNGKNGNSHSSGSKTSNQDSDSSHGKTSQKSGSTKEKDIDKK